MYGHSFVKKEKTGKKGLINSTCESIGISPNNRVAFVGPHSPLAQSGSGTITVCSSSQHILNLQTDLNFIGSLEQEIEIAVQPVV